MWVDTWDTSSIFPVFSRQQEARSSGSKDKKGEIKETEGILQKKWENDKVK